MQNEIARKPSVSTLFRDTTLIFERAQLGKESRPYCERVDALHDEIMNAGWVEIVLKYPFSM